MLSLKPDTVVSSDPRVSRLRPILREDLRMIYFGYSFHRIAKTDAPNSRYTIYPEKTSSVSSIKIWLLESPTTEEFRGLWVGCTRTVGTTSHCMA